VHPDDGQTRPKHIGELQIEKIYIICAFCWFSLAIGVGLFRPEIWKLRGIRRGVENGGCMQCREEEVEEHLLLKCKDTQGLRENFLSSKWLNK
jgi:hypothetical protein